MSRRELAGVEGAGISSGFKLIYIQGFMLPNVQLAADYRPTSGVALRACGTNSLRCSDAADRLFRQSISRRRGGRNSDCIERNARLGPLGRSSEA